ncbi:MAG: GNAT family N-acetyltransferase [Candidatus Saccharimonadales bacterium]
MSLKVSRISPADDLRDIWAQTQLDVWGSDNEMADQTDEAIRVYVSHADNVMLGAYDDKKLVGLLLATKIYTTKQKDSWMLVDGLNVKPSYRRQGIATSLMDHLFKVAKDWNLHEVWLGTEPDNEAANKLYKSLKPIKVERFVAYTFKID